MLRSLLALLPVLLTVPTSPSSDATWKWRKFMSIHAQPVLVSLSADLGCVSLGHQTFAWDFILP